MIVIGDIHGCYKTFMALLKKLPDDEMFLVGDLIDRGPSSKDVVQFVIDHPEIKSVRGNHEEMLLEGLQDPDKKLVWMWNGGGTTLTSYNKLLPLDHIEFIKELPLAIAKDGVSISHSGNPGDSWDRDSYPSYYVEKTKDDKTFHIFGHTPQPKDQLIIGPNYVNIDTGCVYSQYDEHGILTAVQYPQMEFFSQENIDK